MHTPTHAKRFIAHFDRIVESECRLPCYTTASTKVRDGQTNTPKWIEKFSGEMPPGLLSRWRLYALHQDRRSARRHGGDRGSFDGDAQVSRKHYDFPSLLWHQDRPLPDLHHLRYRSPGAQHAIKAAFAQNQSVKTLRQDIDEAIVTPLSGGRRCLTRMARKRRTLLRVDRLLRAGGLLKCQHRRGKTEINRDGGPSFCGVRLECGFEAEIQRDATLSPFKPAY